MDLSELFDLCRYLMALLLFVSVPPSILVWFLVHPFVGFWRRRGPTVYITVMVVFILGSMVGLFLVHDRVLDVEYGANLLLISAGVLCVAVSTWIQKKRAVHLDWNTLAGIPQIAPDGEGPGLLDEGIYAKIRHPRYVEFALGVLGWALVTNYRVSYAIFALILCAIPAVVLLEERELRERFGPAYTEYAQRVPRFIPRW